MVQPMVEPKVIMLAAGGTGGHLFPAMALAEELGRRGITVDLMTDTRGDRYGTGFPARTTYQIPAATLTSRSPFAIAKTLLTVTRGITSAYRVLGKVRPAALIGFGGYPTFPPLVAARLRRIPRAVHEANAVMGRANRAIARQATAIATSFPDTKYLQGIDPAMVYMTGNPVRDTVLHASKTPYPALSSDGKIRLVVFGGSQGARYFSDIVPPALELLPPDIQNRLDVVQQCREEDLERVAADYVRIGIRAQTAAFFTDLPERIAASHLVIARAGASTVAELTVLGRPGLLIPLPHALDNDQLHNATRLANAGAGWCLRQDNLDAAGLAAKLNQILADFDQLNTSARAATALGRPDAVANLADLAEHLAAAGSN